MRTRQQVISFCQTLPGAYEDYPFDDSNWTVMRHRANHRVFAWIFEREGCIWVNVKATPEWGDFWRRTFDAVVPAYHLNKRHWVSVILNGTIPQAEVQKLICESYELTRPAPPKRASCTPAPPR